MKTRIFKINLIAFLLIAMTVSCKKAKDGDVGPQGPQGEQGQQGNTGAQGQTGTANVIYSEWFTVEADDWVGNPEVPSVLIYEHSEPAITADIIDMGAIYVFYRVAEGHSVHMLPYSFSEFSVTTLRNVSFSEGAMAFRMYSEQGVSGATGDFRYVIIPGGNALKLAAPIDYNDYDAVAEYYGLEK
ncbi:MAG: hypothetical protein ACK4ND_11035 [Cytophagaceae bacterium]